LSLVSVGAALHFSHPLATASLSLDFINAMLMPSYLKTIKLIIYRHLSLFHKNETGIILIAGDGKPLSASAVRQTAAAYRHHLAVCEQFQQDQHLLTTAVCPSSVVAAHICCPFFCFSMAIRPATPVALIPALKVLR
jgi:hypothetical protein